jgi:hypothetical protein
MGRKIGELPKFLVFNSRTESIGNSSIFTFSLLLFALYIFLYLPFRVVYFGVSNVFMYVFWMSLDDYPHCTLWQGWLPLDHRPTLPGFPTKTLVRSRPTQL